MHQTKVQTYRVNWWHLCIASFIPKMLKANSYDVIETSALPQFLLHHSNTSSSDVYAMRSQTFSVLPLLRWYLNVSWTRHLNLQLILIA